jgi:hypothetical protein
VTGLAVSIPPKKVSAWSAETDPKYARAWLATLSFTHSREAARELSQALYTLNRMALDPYLRFDLMELYGEPVATVTTALQNQFIRLSLPLTPKRRQLAEFVRQLQMEMAYGYKCCLFDVQKAWLPWSKRRLTVQAVERAMRYLGGVLWHSYQVYMPYPAGVWKEVHELYRFAEENGHEHEQLELARPDGPVAPPTVLQRYLQILLLGLSSPYQLPPGECHLVNRFLEEWAARARLTTDLEIADPAGNFLVDLASDSPPIPYPREAKMPNSPSLRALNAVELVRTLQSFIQRMRQGEATQALHLGFECLESACLDVLQRMSRAWGTVARRRHARMKRHGYLFLCTGLNALHFFSSGQKPFAQPFTPADEGAADHPVLPEDTVPDPGSSETAEPETDETYVSLDEPADTRAPAAPKTVAASSERPAVPREFYRIDRWQIQDIGPQGMLLTCEGEAAAHVRVGDIIGVQQVNAIGRWSAAVVRWLKNTGPGRIEMGIEMLAPDVKPVAVRSAESPEIHVPGYAQAMMLPAVEAAHRPASLLVARGLYQPQRDLLLLEDGAPARRIRPLKLLERTGSFEQVVIAEVQAGSP